MSGLSRFLRACTHEQCCKIFNMVTWKPFSSELLITMHAICKAIEEYASDKSQRKVTYNRSKWSLDSAYIRNILWGQAFFNLPLIIPEHPPIESLLTMCHEKKVNVTVRIRISETDMPDYEDSANLARMIDANPRFKKIMQEVHLRHETEVELKDAYQLIHALLKQRWKLLQEQRPLTPRQARFFIGETERYRPIEVEWLSGDVHRVLSGTLDGYLTSFSKDAIDWGAENVLRWQEQEAVIGSTVRHLIKQFGAECWMKADYFAGEGIRVPETLLVLERKDILKISELTNREGQVEIAITGVQISRLSSKMPDAIGIPSGSALRYADIITDIQLRTIWNKEDPERQAGFQKSEKSALFCLWKELLHHQDEKLNKVQLQNKLKQETKRAGAIRGMEIGKLIENLQRKLASVSNYSRKEIGGWFKNTRDSISLKMKG